MSHSENHSEDFERMMAQYLDRHGVWDKDKLPESRPAARREYSKPHLRPAKKESRSLAYAERPADLEIDLHGFTVDEAEYEFERALKELDIRGLKSLRLIHGGRSGQYGPVKQKLDYLIYRVYKSKIARVLRDPHNDGATWIELAD